MLVPDTAGKYKVKAFLIVSKHVTNLKTPKTKQEKQQPQTDDTPYPNNNNNDNTNNNTTVHLEGDSYTSKPLMPVSLT